MAGQVGGVALESTKSVIEACEQLAVAEVDLVLQFSGAAPEMGQDVGEVTLTLLGDIGVLTLQDVQCLLDVVQTVFDEIHLGVQAPDR